MDGETVTKIYAFISLAFIIAVIIYIIYKVIQANKEYDQNEKQSSIKRTPDQQASEQISIPAELPYSLNKSVFTYHESILFEILDEFCRKNNLVLLSKIRIADFVQPITKNNYYHWFNKISAKHVDFLICQPKTYSPILAIELDDYTHNYKSRKERDDFVNQVYSSVGLPILHITDIRQQYVEKNVAEILGISVSTI